MAKFIHLHNHTHYSLLDAICTPQGLVNAAKEHNMDAIALTDHGVMYGAMEFYNKAKQAGIKPIIGCEVYIVTKGSRFNKGKAEDTKDTMLGMEKSGKTAGKHSRSKSIYDHMVLLAKDLKGYQNLVKLCSIGHTEGFYYKPRIDSEILSKYKDGLVCLSACAGGVVSSYIARGELDEARESAEIYKNIFGAEDFYLEMQNHGMEIEAKIRKHVPKLAKELGLKTIATNDIHYIKHAHHIPHNLYLYISTDLSKEKEGKNLETDLRYETDQVYFKSAEEMCDIFKDFPEAINSTLEVAEKCNLELPRGEYHMPNFPIPANSGAETLDEYIRKLAHEGLKDKIKNAGKDEIDRLDHELDVIASMKFSGYFLIVADFVNHAKQTGIYVGPGRGSAAGSLVCYALGITNVNPLDYNLLFERFLNPERVSMPDIDIDFQDDRRDEVIEYSRRKYGTNSVSQIVTFNRLKTKAVLKDVGRVLNYPFETINEITKHVPSVFGKIKSLTDCYKEIPEFKQYFDQVKERKKLLDYAIVLENLNKNVSMHASGVVIAPSDISDYVPVAKAPQSENQYMTQYDMKMLEDAGLIKMDFLGLKELKILQQAIDLIEQRHNIKINPDTLPLNDKQTYEVFSSGYTIGIFQFSKPKMREYLAKLKPKDINDLAAMNALYRPGPMDLIPEFLERKQGKKDVTYLHEDMKQVLKETYGIIVYQEQVMQLVRIIAGYSLAKADLVRRAMGKKDEKLMREQEDEFVKGAAERGYGKKVAKDIFKLILKFADYGFNKSHSVAYSILAYYTAYLKIHYPLEFMTAQLNCRFGDMDEMVLLINECKRMKISLSLPDINECYSAFTIDAKNTNRILFGLSAIKNVGKTAVENIIKERNEHGRFTSFVEFISRVDNRIVNKKTLEALIYAGAFDCFDKNRKKFFDNYEAAIHRYGVRKNETKGQSSLFDTGKKQEIKDIIFSKLGEGYRDWSDREKLSLEKSVLGLYVSAHPLSDYEEEINAINPFRFSDVQDTDIDEVDFGKLQRVIMCGIITDVKVKMSKKGNRFAVFTLEDFTGQGECVVFPKTYEQYREIMADDNIVTITGKAEENGNTIKLIVDEIKPLVKSAVKNKMPERVVIKIESTLFDAAKLFEIKGILQSSEGESAVIIHLKNGSRESMLELENVKIHYDKYTEKLLTEIFGKDNIILQ
ncbi:MAG: DNA polymerase III subunit alpha [Ignavibacteria bacterium]|nr:DNA polymerase III subunit alpha [Ignavibacteria bacterium]